MYRIKVNGVIPPQINGFENYFHYGDIAESFAYAYATKQAITYNHRPRLILNQEYEFGLGEDAVLITIVEGQ